jgi:hypothetical protein
MYGQPNSQRRQIQLQSGAVIVFPIPALCRHLTLRSTPSGERCPSFSTASALSAEAGGGVRLMQTTVLMTPAEALESMKMAQSDKYLAPG